MRPLVRGLSVELSPFGRDDAEAQVHPVSLFFLVKLKR
jgi:hypothetical protein